MSEYTINDFFCGAGGVALGFLNAGFKINWACDFDKYCVKTYRHNIGEWVVEADVTKLKYSDVPKADGWAFGFPCQDLSVAGKRSGMQFRCQNCGNIWKHKSGGQTDINCPNCSSKYFSAATRSACFFEIMRLLDETKNKCPENYPAFLLAENVKGLRPYITTLTEQLDSRGYDVYIRLYNSKYWGVPQNRERYFIVAIRKGIGGFTFPDEQREYVPKLSTVLDENVDEKYYISDEKAQTIIRQALSRLEELGKVHPCITPNRVEKRQNGRRAKEDEAEMLTLTAQDIHGVIIEATDEIDVVEAICNETGLLNPKGQGRTLRVGRGGLLTKKHNYQHVIVESRSAMNNTAQPEIKVIGMLENSGTTQQHNNRVCSVDGISPTLTAVSGGTHHIKIFDTSRFRVRKLTPTEYGRLQAFPVDGGWVQVVSDTQAYKQFGNAVTVNVVAAIARAIKQSLTCKDG